MYVYNEVYNINIAIEEGNVFFRIFVTDKFVQPEQNVIYTLNTMKIYQDGGSYMYTKINADRTS